MRYAVIIHKDKTSDYGVAVPDLPGCFSAGATMDQALTMAREAIDLHLKGLIDEGMIIPGATPIEKLRKNRQFATGVWTVIDVKSRPNHR